MASADNPYSVDVDFGSDSSVAATSGRVGGAPLANQGGRACLFRTPAGTFSLGNVDLSGNLIVQAVNPTGGSLQVYTGQPSPSSTSQYGTLMMARADLPAPSNYQALQLDQTNALQTHLKSKPTFNVIQVAVTCAANKSLFSFFNSGSTVFRITRVWIYQPPQNTSGALLGQGGTTYYPLIAEIRRITGHTKGTSTTNPTWSSCDTADTPDANVTAYSNATVAGVATSPIHRQDILVTTASGTPFWGRSDQNCKVLVVRPGEGFTITCVSNGQIASGSGTATASVDVLVQATQANA